MHRTYIAGIERGARNVTLKSIEKLARALGVSTDALLSRAGEAVFQPSEVVQERPAGSFLDILLVEDNAEDVELILRAFKRAQITNRIQVVRDGEEALDFLFCRAKYAARELEDRPQLVLLDLKLPKTSGPEVLRRIKKDSRTRMIPVILLAESRRDRHLRECRRLGAAAYIVKPVSFFNFTAITPKLKLRWALLEPPG